MIKTPKAIKSIFHSCFWGFPLVDEPFLYLTFDDGPTDGPTQFVLDCLKEYNAKASFFVIGKNVEQNLTLFNRIIEEGHSIGNHTFNHLKGIQTKNESYFLDIEKCQELVESNYFRPPYGRMSLTQYHHIIKKYKPVYWDILSEDYNLQKTPQECAENVIGFAKNADIVVFHDSFKAFENLKLALPKTLEHFQSLNFTFKALPNWNIPL